MVKIGLDDYLFSGLGDDYLFGLGVSLLQPKLTTGLDTGPVRPYLCFSLDSSSCVCVAFVIRAGYTHTHASLQTVCT